MKKVLFGSFIAFVSISYAVDTNNSFLKSADGYVRAGYQADDNSDQDLALGGKLHIDTKSWNGISAGASFYTTNVIAHNNDGAGYPFFDSDNDSYSILGEAYLQAVYKNTILKVGRQEIDTPFADTDDIGMVPDTYRAAILINKDIPDTTLIAGYLDKWAGIDAPKPEKFTDINGDNGVWVVGSTYEGIKGLTLSAWYYSLPDDDIDGIFYIEVDYEGKAGGISYSTGIQYANQSHNNNTGDDTNIWGLTGSIGYNPMGLTATIAYNKSNDNAADNGFGGGPFFTSAEFETIAEAGKDGDVIMAGLEWDLSNIGFDGLTLDANYFAFEDYNDNDGNELDLSANYAFNDNLAIDLIYANVDNGDVSGNDFENTRVFVNYNF